MLRRGRHLHPMSSAAGPAPTDDLVATRPPACSGNADMFPGRGLVDIIAAAREHVALRQARPWRDHVC